MALSEEQAAENLGIAIESLLDLNYRLADLETYDEIVREGQDLTVQYLGAMLYSLDPVYYNALWDRLAKKYTPMKEEQTVRIALKGMDELEEFANSNPPFDS